MKRLKAPAVDDTQWTRINFDPPLTDPKDIVVRDSAERETNQDLQKSIQQLVCDVHEETNTERGETPTENLLQNLMHANKRTVSFMGKVALENKRASERIESLTRVLVILTFLLFILTVVLVILTYLLASSTLNHLL